MKQLDELEALEEAEDAEFADLEEQWVFLLKFIDLEVL
jgi:hypothetical protein